MKNCYQGKAPRLRVLSGAGWGGEWGTQSRESNRLNQSTVSPALAAPQAKLAFLLIRPGLLGSREKAEQPVRRP